METNRSITKYVNGPEVISREMAFSTKNLNVYHLHLEDDVTEYYLANLREESSTAPGGGIGLLSAIILKGGDGGHMYVAISCPIHMLDDRDVPPHCSALIAELLDAIQEFVRPRLFAIEDNLDSIGISLDELEEYVWSTPFMNKQL